MTQEQYAKKVLKIKKELNRLADELWKNKYVKRDSASRDWLMEKIIDDMFYAEQGKDLLVQLVDTSK